MHKSLRPVLIALVILACCGTLALAQADPKPTSSSDRFFFAFAEDATVADRQWWEGQVGLADSDSLDVTTVTVVGAFQPWIDWEFGGRVGFGFTDANDTSKDKDGSGATDLDLWGKYHLGGTEDLEFAVGGVATIPTGDETAGLGYDSFGVSAFGSMRYRLNKVVLAAHVGLRFSGDGSYRGEDADGETEPLAGVGVIFPFSDRIAGVGEFVFRDGRLDGKNFDAISKDDTRALAGINWRPGGRGMIRAALAAGISDGAPDFQFIAGYAAEF